MRQRNVGIDALKIVSMFMIVMLHVLGQGGILDNLPQYSMRYNVAWFLEIVGLCSVNCFALATGYLNVDKKYNFKSIISLWLQVAFYSITIITFMKFLRPDRVNYSYLSKMFFPASSHAYWYFTAYLGVYLFMPIINFVFQDENRKLLKNSLCLIVILVSFTGLFDSNLIWESNGYSTIWLILMYMIGAYVKKYKRRTKIPLKNLSVFIWCCILNFILKIVAERFFVNIPYLNIIKYTSLNYTTPLLVIASINLFLFFEQYIPKKSELKDIILFFAPMSFGVYLIHTNPAVWEIVMKNRFVFCAETVSFVFLLNLFASCTLIYVACSLVDFVRIKLFEMIGVKNFVSKINDEIEKNL